MDGIISPYKGTPTTTLNKYLLQCSARCKDRGIMQTGWKWAFDSYLSTNEHPVLERLHPTSEKRGWYVFFLHMVRS